MSRELREESAEELFRAARAERPPDGFAERLRAHVEAARTEDQAGPRGSSPPVERALSRRLQWLIAAALAALVSGFFVVRSLRPGAPVTLTAESLRPLEGARGSRAPARLPEADALPSRDPHGPRELSALPRGSPNRAAAPRMPARGADAVPPARPKASPAPSAAESTPLSLTSELGLLKEARALLRGGDAAGALILLSRYENESNPNRLRAEATLLRVEALAAVGQKSESEALARRFITENPDSPLAERARGFTPKAENP